MKKISLLVFGFMAFANAFAQDLPDFDQIALQKKEDYNADANKAALTAATYLLSTPLDKNDLNRLKTAQYLIKWMSGTPEYSFTLDAGQMKFTKKNDDLMIVYMAAMAKYALENKQDAADQKKVQLNAAKTIVLYAKDPAHNVKLNNELKKAIAAEEKGQLAEYLKL